MKIPRKIHRVWIGGEMPPEFVAYEERWRELHPGWEVRTWREADLGWLQNRGPFADAPKLSSKSNIARYEIVLREGGLYVDTDYEPLRSFESLIHADAELVVAQEEPDFLANAIFAAVPSSPVLRSIVDELPASHYSRDGEISPQRTGPHYFTRGVRRALAAHPDVVVQVLEREAVIPYSWKQEHLAGLPFPHAHAVHHWAMSWVPPAPAGGSARRAQARRRAIDAAGGLKRAAARVREQWNRLEPQRPSGTQRAVALGDGRVLLVTASGLPVVVGAEHVDDVASVLADGEREPAFLAFVRRELRDGDVVAHVGASVGLTALACAWRVGRMGRVYAIDADERALGLFETSAELSRRRGLQADVRAVRARIGRASGESTLDDVLRGNPDVGLLRIAVARDAAEVLATAGELLADRAVRFLALRLDDVAAGASWGELAERLRAIDRAWRPASFALAPDGTRRALTVEAAINSDRVEHFVLDFGERRG